MSPPKGIDDVTARRSRTQLTSYQVRCNGRQPCDNCSQAGLACTYDAVPQKKGPKGSRAKVISELRETQRQIEQASQYSGSPPESPKDPRTPGLMSLDTCEQCIEFFFAHMYPTMPILDRDEVNRIKSNAERSFEAYCLLCALSAFMMIQPGINQSPYQRASRSPSPATNPALGVSLMDEAVRVRKNLDYVEHPTVATVITSFFLFGCCFGLNKHNTAWLHLRDATAIAQLLGMQEEVTYTNGSKLESALKRRLFWLLFVTERYVGLVLSVPCPSIYSCNACPSTRFAEGSIWLTRSS